MAQQSRSRQEPKLETAPASEIPGVESQTYRTKGLEVSDYMPIRFEGRDYNLASLTADEVDYLLQFPDQVPYLEKVD
jgi:hypothetical protein